MTMQAEDLARLDRFKADVAAGDSTAELAAKYGVGETRAKVARRLVLFALETHIPAATSTTEYSTDGTRSVEAIRDRPVTMKDARAWISADGDDPDDFNLSIRSIAYGRDMFSNRMSGTPKHGNRGGIKIDPDVIARWRDARVAPGTIGTADRTAVVCLADLQLGKREGSVGTPDTLARLDHALEQFVAQLDGSHPKRLLLANLGDHTEGTNANYASQAYSVDLNLRDQLSLAVDVSMKWITTLAPYFEEIVYAATLCNHGELSRGGGKGNVTDDADNATGVIVDTLGKILPHTDMTHVRLQVPTDKFIEPVTIGGVNVALAHGHKIAGNERTWLMAQSQALHARQQFTPDVWLTAHRHHASIDDYGPFTRIQATTVDPGSKWFEDATGQYSTPGVTTFEVSPDFPMKWARYQIL